MTVFFCCQFLIPCLDGDNVLLREMGRTWLLPFGLISFGHNTKLLISLFFGSLVQHIVCRLNSLQTGLPLKLQTN